MTKTIPCPDCGRPIVLRMKLGAHRSDNTMAVQLTADHRCTSTTRPQSRPYPLSARPCGPVARPDPREVASQVRILRRYRQTDDG